jgi:hypothetical protein
LRSCKIDCLNGVGPLLSRSSNLRTADMISMKKIPRLLFIPVGLLLPALLAPACGLAASPPASAGGIVPVSHAIAHDVSPPLLSLRAVDADEDTGRDGEEFDADEERAELPPQALAPKGAGVDPNAPQAAANVVIPPAAISIEQTNQGSRPPPETLASFDGLGESFVGPQGAARLRNPSDNTLAVGPDHIVQIVNTRMAVFTKKGKRFDTTGRVLYGPVETRNIFKGFADAGEINNGDAVVRYDQLADRWLIVMPIFRRLPARTNAPAPGRLGEPATRSQPAVRGQPGPAQPVYLPPTTPTETQAAFGTNFGTNRGFGRGRGGGRGGTNAAGAYAMCYAISTSSDPLGSYYRYEFIRPLFPDYPRPAVWPDGYYVPTSTGDNVVQKQAYVVERAKMLKGEDATEQGIIIDGVNFLNNAGRRRNAVEGHPRRRRHLRVEIPCGLEESVQDETGRAGEDRRGAVPLPGRWPVNVGRAPAGDRTAPGFAGRQGYATAGLPPDWQR